MERFFTSIPIVSLAKGEDCIQYKEDLIIKEQRIALYLNGKKLLSTMSLPKDQDAHAVGFLMSEGVIECMQDITHLSIAKDGFSVYVEAKINEENINNLFHEKTLTSGCCVGVSANFEGKIVEKFISTDLHLPQERLWDLIENFEQDSGLFEKTGCVHKAILVFEDGTQLVSEDVGRHNAIDKVVGKARLDGIDISRALLVVSGRLSMEMVIKAAMHNIAIVISRSATTELGIKSAQLLGITLIGFARGNRCNIYTHPYRILGAQDVLEDCMLDRDFCAKQELFGS
ncbi:MAG: formate dehydrogenase accessory sulfurtransferase FdhD [Helicobacter sp.]|nr:formate dehydrogenase accessory sulfurtransferase FdhD [Helicobacter sp.]MDD7567622.1 formate dehydrogenase accessory sulfurtransferase FdhD [Helicobacter sp.]MDY5740642.1 formate dehydrogenase accessory sulfurtransferase FdhD [Helicobacter sp.]